MLTMIASQPFKVKYSVLNMKLLSCFYQNGVKQLTAYAWSKLSL